ncbi:MAG TPA: hypothetical protein VEI52_08015 [Terriglobales bacterium]|nr:hypothetical protein [Terriglobales bacterium]
MKRANEILEILDSEGTLDPLRFMPEMAAYCGQRLRVAKRVVKTCYYGMDAGRDANHARYGIPRRLTLRLRLCRLRRMSPRRISLLARNLVSPAAGSRRPAFRHLAAHRVMME